MAGRVVVNGSHLGQRLNGIGSYILSLLRQWSTMGSSLQFEVYLHEQARPHFEALSFPENFSLHWISARAFADRDNVRRLLFSNLLAAARRRHVIFNPSQLEMTFWGARRPAIPARSTSRSWGLPCSPFGLSACSRPAERSWP